VPVHSLLGLSLLALLIQETGLPKTAAREPQVWCQWRGPLGTGSAPGAKPPITWSEHENVRWKTALPVLGQSSPVVTGELVFLTCAIPFGEWLYFLQHYQGVLSRVHARTGTAPQRPARIRGVDDVYTSPLVDDSIYLRGDRFLYCLGGPKADPPSRFQWQH